MRTTTKPKRNEGISFFFCLAASLFLATRTFYSPFCACMQGQSRTRKIGKGGGRGGSDHRSESDHSAPEDDGEEHKERRARQKAAASAPQPDAQPFAAPLSTRGRGGGRGRGRGGRGRGGGRGSGFGGEAEEGGDEDELEDEVLHEEQTLLDAMTAEDFKDEEQEEEIEGDAKDRFESEGVYGTINLRHNDPKQRFASMFTFDEAKHVFYATVDERKLRLPGLTFLLEKTFWPDYRFEDLVLDKAASVQTSAKEAKARRILGNKRKVLGTGKDPPGRFKIPVATRPWSGRKQGKLVDDQVSEMINSKEVRTLPDKPIVKSDYCHASFQKQLASIGISVPAAKLRFVHPYALANLSFALYLGMTPLAAQVTAGSLSHWMATNMDQMWWHHGSNQMVLIELKKYENEWFEKSTGAMHKPFEGIPNCIHNQCQIQLGFNLLLFTKTFGTPSKPVAAAVLQVSADGCTIHKLEKWVMPLVESREAMIQLRTRARYLRTRFRKKEEEEGRSVHAKPEPSDRAD